MMSEQSGKPGLQAENANCVPEFHISPACLLEDELLSAGGISRRSCPRRFKGDTAAFQDGASGSDTRKPSQPSTELAAVVGIHRFSRVRGRASQTVRLSIVFARDVRYGEVERPS